MNTDQLQRGIAIRKELVQQNEIRMAVEASALRGVGGDLYVSGNEKGHRVDFNFKSYPYLLPLFEQFGADLIRAIEEHTAQLDAEFGAL